MTDTPFEHSELGQVRALVDRAEDDPQTTADLAAQHLASDNPLAHAVARWAIGKARFELNDFQGAVDELTLGAAMAEDRNDVSLRDEIRVSWSYPMFHLGHRDDAFDALTEVAATAATHVAAKALSTHATLLLSSGDLDAALDHYERALPLLVDTGDQQAQARVLSNRGVAYTMAGRWSAAEADLQQLDAITEQLGLRLLNAGALHNLGYLHGRRGNVAIALDLFGRAAAVYAEAGNPPRLVDALAADHAEVLLDVGLAEEALTLAEQAVDRSRQADSVTREADAHLLMARACLETGDARAEHHARAASAILDREDRDARVAYADHLALQAALAQPGSDQGDIDFASLAARLEANSLIPQAIDVRVEGARHLLRLGQDAAATQLLDALAPIDSDASARLRARLAHAQAMRCDLLGDADGCRAAIDLGLEAADQLRNSLGASELRAAAGHHVAELARLDIAMALTTNDARRLFVSADRARAQALRIRPTRASLNTDVADLLTDLRAATAALDDAQLAGADDEHIAGLDARVHELEQVVSLRIRSQGIGTDAAAVATSHVDLRVLDELLRAHQSHFIQLIEDGDTLWALHRRGGEMQLRNVGNLPAIADQRNGIAFALQRLATGRGSQRSLDAASDALADSVDELAALLIDVGDAVPAPDVIVVSPSASLYALPWNAIGRAGGVAIEVTPSAAMWHRAVNRATATDRHESVFVAGPGLPGALGEVVDLAGDEHRHLIGDAATVANTLQSLQTSGTAHLACHGRFRPRSPMFSSLQLVDGPLTIHDLEGLDQVPSVIVMPSCDAAQVNIAAGTEPIGLPTTLLAMGVEHVVAPITIVNDEATGELMRLLHAELTSGSSPAAALGQVIDRTLDHPLLSATAATFVVLAANRGGRSVD